MTKVSEKEILKTPVFTVVEKEIKEAPFKPVGLNCAHWVMVVALDSRSDKTIIVRQSRWGVEKETIPVVSKHDVIGAPMALDFCKKLGMSNDDSEFVSELARLHMRMHQLTKIKSRFSMLKLTNHPFFNDIVTLAKADESACIKTVDDEWIGVEQALKVPLASECVGVPMPKPLVTGDDLIAVGKKPGPEFKRLLEIGMKLQIDQNQNKESILKQLKNM